MGRRSASDVASPIPELARPLPFAGRAQELAVFAQLRQAAAHGSGQVLFLSGDGGVGKTRLLREAAHHARSDDWQVAIGEASALAATNPFAVFADALTPLLQALDAGARMRLTRGDPTLLSVLAPTLWDRADAATRDRPRDSGVSPAEQRVRLHAAVAQLLARLTERQPLLLALENLQWADSASIELLHVLGRQVGAQRLLLVATWNETERAVADDLRLVTRSLRARGVARDLALAPLTRDAVCEVLVGHFAATPTAVADFADRLHHATQGNAFFVDQLLRELVVRGDLHRRSEGWTGWHVDTLALPPSVRDVLEARLERLTAEARAVAELLAVAGTTARHDVVRAVLGADDTTLESALQPLRAAGLVAEQAEGDAIAYRFVHPLLQQALLDTVGRVRARAWHGALALALEAMPRDGAADVDAIATHWLHADPRQETTRAIGWLVRAGRDAMARLARREGVTMLQAALDRWDALAQRLPDGATLDDATDPDAPLDAALRRALLDELMRAYRRLGDFHRVIELARRAIATALETGDDLAVAIAERRYGLALQALGRREEALEHFATAVARARAAGDTALVVRTQLARGDALQALGQADAAKRDLSEALTMAESLDDVALLARAHRLQLMLHLWTGPAHRAWAYARSAVQLAERSGERNVRWHAHYGAAVLAGLTSRTDALTTHLHEATRLARELASPLLELRCAEIAIEYHAGTGAWDRALAEGESAVALARALDQTTLRARLLHWLSGVYAMRGDLAQAHRLVDEAWEVLDAGATDRARPFEVHGVLPAHVARVRTLVASGEHAAALTLGREALAMAERTGYVAWSVYRLLPAMAEAALACGDAEALHLVRGRLARDAAQLAHPIGAAWLAVIDGEMATARGAHTEAIAHLQRAIAQFEAVPFPFDAAQTRLRLARSCMAAGARDDAVLEARAALAMFDTLGAAPAQETARAMLRALGARVPTPAPHDTTAPRAFASLSARELDIVRLVARRLSNKAIGAQLGITARTAGTHLANIYDKVGVRDRTALGDLAREAGL
ncbi:MAG: AAA family ATPase [Gemmatimonadetes bacterium]|nr:AAA family ATPase [Gemmatimonadota bacterium]